MSRLFLQRADALLAVLVNPENYGKEFVVASRIELDSLLEQVREREVAKMFSFRETIWKCFHSTGWMAFCQSGMKGQVTASTWKELQASIKSAVLGVPNDTNDQRATNRRIVTADLSDLAIASNLDAYPITTEQRKG